MGLKLKQRGDIWHLSGTVRGVQVRETTGTADRDTAEAIRIRREAEVLQASVHGQGVTLTFDQAAERYLRAGGSTRFLERVRAHFRSDRLINISQSDLAEAAAKLYPGCAPETVNRQCYTPFIAVWNHAAGDDLVPKKEWRRPRKKKGTGIRKARRAGTFPVTYERAAEFIGAMWTPDAIAMTILFYTGMRPIELFTLTDQQVNIEGRWISLPSSKTGEPRGVPMHNILVPLFTALLDAFEGEIIVRFNHDTHQLETYPVLEDSGWQLSASVNAARRTTKIKDITPYTARHTVSTHLVMAGVHEHVKDEILGHAATSMSRRYTEVPQAPLIEAINLLPVPDAVKHLPIAQNPHKALDRVREIVSDKRLRGKRALSW